MVEEWSGDVWIEEFLSVLALHRAPGRKYIQERSRPRLKLFGNHRKHDSPNHGRLFGRRPIQPTERESQKQQKSIWNWFRQRVFLQLGRKHTLHTWFGRIEVNNFLHEMFHVFKPHEPISSFKKFYDEQRDRRHYAHTCSYKGARVDGQKRR